ncbi:MAG TPA: HAD family hydrolase [Candidatus Omnitrophica bacterium]|nr:MAG: hypothetical protein A3I71_06090 [Omnitrophica WOR_2 bacterium RIFCSPLOWO2_02_FULL_63_16]OGX48169.1 MAG: hypothetical protein A3G88_04060 [Omnitrophica WOR_2 bacterium RIFCSPLOWO2_12_FULL_63_16]HBH97434.1 HAD family hydrolase [Candidatus Omnitrophota bacterium]
MIQAIVFDFDGVLVESAVIKTEAFHALFALEGPAVVDQVVAYHLAHEGVSRVEKFRYSYAHILHRPLDDQALRALCDRFQRLVMERIVQTSWVVGATEALEWLRRRKIGAFVVSGTPHEELCTILERRSATQRFLGIYGSPPAKPERLASLLSRHGLRGTDVLMVGDAITDYEAAHAAGMRFVARAHPTHAGMWEQLGVERIQDLTPLPALVARGALH